MDKHIAMTLVTREGCGHCAQTKELLKKIQPEYPELSIKEVDMVTAEGQELISRTEARQANLCKAMNHL